MSAPEFRPRAVARGFSLVEIMVAMVVGLIGMIVVFQVFAVFEGQKRTTTSGGDAQQNGTLALFTIEREARMAGYGINYAPLAGCTVLAYDAGPPVRNFTFTMSAAQIVDGANGAPDSITFVYGNSDAIAANVPLSQPAPAAGNVYVVDLPFGFVVGDILITGEVGKNCSLSMLTSRDLLNPGNLPHDVGNYTDKNNVIQTARYNKAGGLGVDYSAWSLSLQTGGRLFDFGLSPTVAAFSIDPVSSQLTVQYLMRGVNTIAAVDGIVQMQAQYGKDKVNNDGIVDTWETTAPVTAADWAQVLALRLAIVARSGQPEKPNPTTLQCNTTVVGPTTNLGVIDLSADPNWKCYRYKTFETVVALRNQIWAPK